MQKVGRRTRSQKEEEEEAEEEEGRECKEKQTLLESDHRSPPTGPAPSCTGRRNPHFSSEVWVSLSRS